MNKVDKLEILKNEEYIIKIMKKSEEICKTVCTYKDKDYMRKTRKIDKILTSKIFGIPIMLMFLGIIFWLTIIGANYPSSLLFNVFASLGEKITYLLIYINCPDILMQILMDRSIFNSYLGYICNVTTNGYIFSYIYFFRRFRIFT